VSGEIEEIWGMMVGRLIAGEEVVMLVREVWEALTLP
jgi:hypothetical protein